MSNATKTDAPRPAAPAAGTEDLSGAVQQTVVRESGDIVRCTRVSERHYRCNWWHSVITVEGHGEGRKGGHLAATYRVRKSSFLEVTGSAGADLRIRDISRPKRTSTLV